VAKSLLEIVEKVRQVDTLAAEVASASKEQSQGIEQVNTAVTQMDKVTQANAANAEESASASEELSAQAQVLKETLVELLALVGVHNTGQARAHIAAPATLKTHAESAPSPKTNGVHHRQGHPETPTVKRQQAAFSPTNGRSEDGVPSAGDFREF
jgi:type IV secretory pathway VirJ component